MNYARKNRVLLLRIYSSSFLERRFFMKNNDLRRTVLARNAKFGLFGKLPDQAEMVFKRGKRQRRREKGGYLSGYKPLIKPLLSGYRAIVSSYKNSGVYFRISKPACDSS